MENSNENTSNPKQRHGCVTAWLSMMIVSNSITALIYLFAKDIIAQNLPGVVSNTMMILLALLGIGNVIFSILLLKWKKIGFWGFLITSIAALFINLNIGLSVGQSLLGLLGIVILYGVLQIKKDDVPTWGNLE